MRWTGVRVKVTSGRAAGAVLLAVLAATGLWCWREAGRVPRSAAPLSADAPAPEFDQPAPADESELLYSTRTWRAAEPTSGIVELYALPGGHRVLRLAHLTTGGAAGRTVALSPEPYTSGRLGAGLVGLGRLARAHGSATYPIPDTLDLAGYRSVVLWPARGGTAVAAAPITR